MSLKVTIIGAGYVGLVTGACLAEFGNDVLFLDVNHKKISTLDNGDLPIYEPGLKQLIDRNRAEGRITFSTDVVASVAHGDVQFITVDTPPVENGAADLQRVFAAARNIGRYMDNFKVIVDKSTVPVGTAEKVRAALVKELQLRGIERPHEMFSVVSNPEFLKEGAAVDDFMRPDRIVLGTEADKEGVRARDIVRALYAPLTPNHERFIHMDLRSAEFTKYAANAMLATRISFINEMANLADCVGVDIELVRQGIGSDPRIGYSFLYSGTGYGGSCFPKDIQALMKTARECGQPLHVLEAVEQVNTEQKAVLVRKVVRKYGEDLSGRTFAVWGLAFKPNTDDMREAPSIVVISELLKRGASIQAFDPVAAHEAQRVMNERLHEAEFARLTFHDDRMNVLKGCDALLIITDWKAFRSPDFQAIKAALKHPIIFDGRNLYEPDLIREAGIIYHAVGRSKDR